MLKTAFFITLFIAFHGLFKGYGTNLESLQISKINCDYLGSVNETGAVIPRFSWIVTSRQRGAAQIAYQVEAATSPERLGNGNADLWNTGKVFPDKQCISLMKVGA